MMLLMTGVGIPKTLTKDYHFIDQAILERSSPAIGFLKTKRCSYPCAIQN
jgi:hypothetical protein